MVHCPAFAMRAVGTESIWRHGPLHAHCDARRLQRSALLRCGAGTARAASGTQGEIPAWAVHSDDQGAQFVHWGGTDRGGRPGNRCFPWRNTNTSKRYARARGPRALQQTQPLQHSQTYKHNRTPDTQPNPIYSNTWTVPPPSRTPKSPSIIALHVVVTTADPRGPRSAVAGRSDARVRELVEDAAFNIVFRG